MAIAPVAGGGGVNNVVRLVETGAGRYLWKGYRATAEPMRIVAEHRLLAWLAGAGLPFAIPAPVATRDGATLLPAPAGAGWRALFPWLTGGPPDGRDPATLAALGAALGALHLALARLPAALRPARPAYGELARVHPAIPDPFGLTPTALGLPESEPYAEALAAWRAALADVGAFIAGPYAALPRQVIHGDFVPGNALTEGDRITAILDFEFVLWDARILDLAAGVAQALARGSRDPQGALALTVAFGRGYAWANRLTAAEIAPLPGMLLLREAVAAIYWLGRAREDGDARPGFAQLRQMRALSAWLERHGAALRKELGRAMAGD